MSCAYLAEESYFGTRGIAIGIGSAFYNAKKLTFQIPNPVMDKTKMLNVPTENVEPNLDISVIQDEEIKKTDIQQEGVND